jgi:hypothetical protein
MIPCTGMQIISSSMNNTTVSFWKKQLKYDDLRKRADLRGFYGTALQKVGMHRILFLPDIRPAGYPANPKAGYRISDKGRIPDIRPDIRPDSWLYNYIFGKIHNTF